jgi:nicotinate-nucleotide adenylyltransferase
MLAPVRTGILGGTFDPPHVAHLLAGESAYRQLGLDRVLFIPAGSPWQKSLRRVSEPVHRWEMTRLAVDGVGYFVADDREVMREGWTYTVDTLATFPEDEELVLILGSDAAAGIGSWERVGEVTARAALAVAMRPGAPSLPEEVAADAIILDMPRLEISGTMIRARATAGVSIRFLVPDSVWEYVAGQGLYGR